MEVAAGSLARWADTYLMPEEAAGSPALAAAFGAGSQGGAQAAQLLISLALAALTRYPGEKALHEVGLLCGCWVLHTHPWWLGGLPSTLPACLSACPQVVCAQLLAALVRRRAVCASLRDAPAWHALCDAVGCCDAGLLQLAERVQRRLLQSLLLAAEGWPGEAGSWAGQLLEGTAAQLRQLGASEAAARAALQRADGLHLLTSLLGRLRGAVRGTLPPTQQAILQQVGLGAGVVHEPQAASVQFAAALPPPLLPPLTSSWCRSPSSEDIDFADPSLSDHDLLLAAAAGCSSPLSRPPWPPCFMPAAPSPPPSPSS